MNDKSVKIGIETMANTSGAEKAVVAIDDVVDKGKELEAVLDDADGKELKKIPANAAPAIGSIKQLENEVEKLQGELARLPVGSEQFVAMAGKVNAAKKSLEGAHAEAKKYGASVGRSGNVGMAALEFSRAFEDAQYGIRGVLNNLPGLIAMLGGSAGLAGVISIVAVAGTQLWEMMNQGTEDSKKTAIDYLEIYKKLAAEFGNSSLEGEKARGASLETNLAKAKEYEAVQQRTADSELGLEKQRIKGDGGVAVAKTRLDLSRIETDLRTASGEAAVKLERNREAAIKRIIELEKQNLEQLRQADENAANAKVAKAQEAADNADRSKSSAGGRAVDKNTNLTEVAGQLAKAVEERLKSEQAAITEKAVAQKQMDETSNPFEKRELLEFIKKMDEAIAKLQTPGDQESQLIVRRDEAEAAAKQAAENFKKASDDQLAAAAALKAAAENAANLKTANDQNRKNEGEIEVINRAKDADDKVATGKGETVEKLDDLVGAIGDAGGKDLAPFITEMKVILQDKALSADEMARVPVLMAQYFGKIANLGAAQNAAFREAQGQIDELVRDIKGIKSQLSNPNP